MIFMEFSYAADKLPETKSFEAALGCQLGGALLEPSCGRKEAVRDSIEDLQVCAPEFAAFGQYRFTGNHSKSVCKAITKI